MNFIRTQLLRDSFTSVADMHGPQISGQQEQGAAGAGAAEVAGGGDTPDAGAGAAATALNREIAAKRQADLQELNIALQLKLANIVSTNLLSAVLSFFLSAGHTVMRCRLAAAF